MVEVLVMSQSRAKVRGPVCHGNMGVMQVATLTNGFLF